MGPRPAPLTTLLALALVAGPRPAAAEPRDAASEQASAGTAAYNLGHYDEAAAHYEAAYRAVPDPILLFDLGQAYRLGGQPESALVAYRSYLRTAAANAPNRDQVTRRIQELEQLVAARKRAPAAPSRRPPPASRAAETAPAYLRAPAAAERQPAVYERGWFWGSVGAVVAAGVVAAFVLGRHTENPIRGSVDPGVVVVR